MRGSASALWGGRWYREIPLHRWKLLLPLALAAAIDGAAAQGAPSPDWTLGLTGGWSAPRDTGSDDTLLSLTVWLERQIGQAFVGGSITIFEGDDAVPETVSDVDRSSVSGSIWVAAPVGPAEVDLTVIYGRERFDGVFTSDGPFGSMLDLEADTDIWSVAGGVSTVFRSGDVRFIPRASLRYDSSQTDAGAIAGIGPIAQFDENQDGLTGSLGLRTSWAVRDRLSLSLNATGLAAENGAASAFAFSGRNGPGRPTVRQDETAAQWAELSGGVSIFPTERSSLSISGGTTLGRDIDEVFVSVGISRSF